MHFYQGVSITEHGELGLNMPRTEWQDKLFFITIKRVEGADQRWQ